MKKNEMIVEWYDKTRRDEKGKTTGLLAIGVDVTRRRQLEEERRESEKKYFLITENTNDFIVITDLSLDAKFLYVSPSYDRILGHNTESLIGTSSLAFIHPDSLVLHNTGC